MARQAPSAQVIKQIVTLDDGQRMDLVTIDGKYSRDLDDAMWVERAGDGYRVTVAVSDVSSLVEPGSELDTSALARGFTIYRGTRVARPMLPNEISEDAASLNQGATRPAVVVVMTLDRTLDVVGLEIERRQVRIRKRLDHDEALQFAAGNADGSIGEMLRLALSLSAALLVRRRTAGAMTFHDPRSGLVMNEEGRVLHLGRAASAYVLVQEMMIMTNAVLARRMAERGIALLYRNHRARVTANREALMADAALVASGDLDAMMFESRRALVLGRAELGTTIEGHYGLNLPVYCWFTSPIRRYADLVNHRVLLADLSGAPLPDGVELGAIANSLNELYRIENDERGAQYKRRALESAVGEFERADPEEMDAAAFTQAIKAVSNGVDLGTAAIEEMRRRSHVSALTSKDLYRLLTNDSAMAEATRMVAAEHLVRCPHDAYGLFGHAQRTTGWKLADERVATGAMPDGTSMFRADTIVEADGRKIEATCYAPSKKNAMQKALASCLVRFADVEPPEEWSHMPPAARFSGGSGKTSDAPVVNAKGALIAACVARKWPAPAFEMVQAGPPHARTFSCTVRVSRDGGSVEAKGRGASKKEAESQAATEALFRIGPPAKVTSGFSL